MKINTHYGIVRTPRIDVTYFGFQLSNNRDVNHVSPYYATLIVDLHDYTLQYVIK